VRFLAGYFDASTGEQHQGQHSGNRWQWHQDYGYWYGSHGEGGKKTKFHYLLKPKIYRFTKTGSGQT
jgi:hypothetical protein